MDAEIGEGLRVMLRAMRAILVVVALGRVAHGEAVNLLTHTPARIAVSSAVNSDTFVPDHLVDGDRKTAWNSAPGDAHASIQLRIPANAHVDTIRLTTGFTTGAWFKQNLRIKKLTLRHLGKSRQITLDPDSDKLQDIPIDDTGGDYTLTVDETVRGTNKDWDEVVVSELEVWGTTPEPRPASPHVMIGSLDVDCVHALWPKAKGARVSATEGVTSVDWTEPLCTVERHAARSTTSTTTLALMKGLAVTDKIERTYADEDPGRSRHSLSWTAFDLGRERALVVDDKVESFGDMTGSRQDVLTLYRYGTGKLVPVTTWEEGAQSVEMWSQERSCTLKLGKSEQPMPELVLTCVETTTGFEAKDNKKTTAIIRFHWHGTAYDTPEGAQMPHVLPQ